MKPRNVKTLFFIGCAALCMLIPKQVHAQDYYIVYMDSIASGDTVYNCGIYDSIKFIPNADITSNLRWIVEDYTVYGGCADTINRDTLCLPGSFTYGSVRTEGRNGTIVIGTKAEIRSVSLSVQDKSGTCGSQVQLNASLNYTGSGNVSYNWEPAEGLSDPFISNPTALISGDMDYTVTLTIPDGCVLSETVQVTLETLDNPSIFIVTVDSANKNVVYWEKPVSDAIDSFLIYKETHVTDEFQKIGAVGYDHAGYFVDTASYPLVQSNRYILSLQDTCGFESAASAPHKTIHLAINQGLSNSWNLIWEPYEGFDVSTYYIYRGTSSEDLGLIGSIAGSSCQYTDFGASSEYVFYQIEAVSPDAYNTSGLKTTCANINSSRSNIATNYTATGLSDVTGLRDFCKVYPNPFSDNVFIELDDVNVQGGTIEVSDLSGRIVKVAELKAAKTEIDDSGLKNGLYFLKIKSDRRTIRQVMVKN